MVEFGAGGRGLMVGQPEPHTAARAIPDTASTATATHTITNADFAIFFMPFPSFEKRGDGESFRSEEFRI